MFKKIRFIILSLLTAFNIYLIFLFAGTADGLGHTVKILYIHVPSAWIGSTAFAAALISSVIYLIKEKSVYAQSADLFAKSGFILMLFATATGSIWARLQWNSFWNWDPRQTSIVILLIIYCAYFAINSAISNIRTRYKAASVYLIAAALSTPFLIFAIPRLYYSLHPSPLITSGNKPSMNGDIMLTLFYSLTVASWIYIEYIIYKISKLSANGEEQ